MAFNEDLVDLLLKEDDRDRARFFAGRDEAIRKFDDAIDAAGEAAGEKVQAVFRVFQGAPGCGKTSLALHLLETRGSKALFVRVLAKHLASDDALAERVRHVATEAGSAGARVAAVALRTNGSRMRMQPAGDAMRDALVDKAVEKNKIVLHMDEAQTVDDTARQTLVGLHAGEGLGVPTVFLFTGLSHTESRLRSIEGLSRLADNVALNMGAMSEGECVQSTAAMLNEIDADGTDAEKHRAASLVASLSHGWPQHLHCAQMAMCRELKRTGGVARDVRVDKVREESDRRRGEYYANRLDGSALHDWPDLTTGVVGQAMRERPPTFPALTKICRSEAERLGLDVDPDFEVAPREFAAAMVEKGVLAFAPDRRYDVAIPSMARWLGISGDGRKARWSRPPSPRPPRR